MQNFKEKNLTHTIIQHPSSISSMCVFSSLAHTANPVMQVSKAGFSSDDQQALAYVGFTWAPLAGSGNYYMLSNNNGKWNIVGSVMIWIS
jgi:hypothetical protein